MNAAGLLKHFDRIAEAPDAVERLRRFVLDLAVRGKLGEQDASDESATQLLGRIDVVKKKLVDDGSIPTKAAAAPVLESDTPFLLPANWQWARFGDICDFSAGRTPSRHDHSYWNSGDHPWASIADLDDGQTLLTTKETVSEKARLSVFGAAPQPVGTMLMSFKLTIGKIARLGIAAFHNEAIISIRPHLAELDPYLFKVLPAAARQGVTKAAIKGATLNRESLTNILIPLPPLAEQHRIVAKVDELMALCDQLQAAHTARESQRDALVAASLHRLTAPEATPDQPAPPFTDAARFHLTHLPRLTTRPEHIQQLRQTILNLAVRGRLVSQDSNDEPATSLLQKMAPGKSPSPDSRSLADGWTIANISDCFVVSGGIQKTPLRTPNKNPHSYVGVSNVYRGRLDLVALKQFELYDGELDRYRLVKGDILVVEGNGSPNEIGRCAIWSGEVDDCVHQNHIIRCRPANPEIAPFVLLFLNSPAGIDLMKSMAITSSGLYSLSVGKIRSLSFPLPPLTEQHRIVAKVDELMQLCDALQAELVTGQTQGSRLLEALLHEALNPSHENVVDIEQARKKRHADREAIACYTVRRLAKHKSFGRTMQAKVLYMAEAHCKQSLGGTWRRQARGPYDGWIGDFEAQAKQANWFSATETTLTSGKPKVVYTPGTALDTKANEALVVLGVQASEFDRLLTLFSEKTTEEVEIIATLFAAWNDLLLDANTPSDDDIVKVVREQWHPDKARFTPDALKRWMTWMRQQHLTPAGIGPHTQYQAGLL